LELPTKFGVLVCMSITHWKNPKAK